VRSRETETFHLIRSPSAGAVQPTGQSIIVAGEQWEVVGGGAQRSRTKKEKDDAKRSNAEPERRDSKRQERLSEKVAVLSLPDLGSLLTHQGLTAYPSEERLAQVALEGQQLLP
jgi:hypothetical protein